MKILVHTSFIGITGYNNHSRSFFTALNKYHTVKIRNLTVGSEWKGMSSMPHNEEYVTDEMRDMMILQTLYNSDGNKTDYPIYGYDGNYKPDVNIILNDLNNTYFFDDYEGYKIAYNVWETTRYPDDFFKRLLYFDEVWVPTQWQMDCLIDQGYPKERISVVNEGIDIETFKPISIIPEKNKFRFLLFGRWEYRKSTTEILRVFLDTFKGMEEKVEMICSIENPYPNDGLKTTEERCIKNEIHGENLKFVNFPSREEYVKYLQGGDVFVSCSRSEGWNLPLIESLACGTPSIYSDWGGQLEFAQGLGLPVKIFGLKPANFERKDFTGEYCEPDFDDLSNQMMNAYENYVKHKEKAILYSEYIHKNFTWDNAAKIASNILETKFNKEFVFVTAGNSGYMSVIEKLVHSINEFSLSKIIVYGVSCDIPFDYSCIIKRTINPPTYSEHDKWYWKQYACIESLKEGYKNLVWIDGDVVVNYNIDNIVEYFPQIENYPLSDIHLQEEYFGHYDKNKSESFNEELCKEWNIKKYWPYMHICMFIYNEKCMWWFDEIIKRYKSIELSEYKKLFLWNDEGIDNALRWEYGFKKHLPISNFDTSSYDGDDGFTNKTLHHFYKFNLEEGPQNFNRIFGYQVIPKDKSKIIYFHGNKDINISDKMIEFIKLKRDNIFYNSEYFYTDIYNLENLGSIKNESGRTMEIAGKYGWDYAIYHEIYNLRDYYNNREKRINNGDIVVDLGGNIGIFNRWAYSEGASKVISFEPDKRYFKLLGLNADPRSILFNAAVSDSIGSIKLYESSHLGGSNIFGTSDNTEGYPVRTYTLNYLFESGLIDKIDFLKVDIEGAEHKAFYGISDENLMKIRTISMEYHNSFTDFDDSLRDKFIYRLNKLGFNSYLLFLGTNNALQMIYFWK